MGLVFGGIALAFGAGTGRSRLAGWVATGVALVSYFVWSFFPLSESFAPWARLSPFDLYLGSDPLSNGMAWGDAAIMAVAFLVLVGLSIPLFQRRDLRG
jgi:ABC-2 type transport system permease protein